MGGGGGGFNALFVGLGWDVVDALDGCEKVGIE